jgi:hypothetical protein
VLTESSPENNEDKYLCREKGQRRQSRKGYFKNEEVEGGSSKDKDRPSEIFTI